MNERCTCSEEPRHRWPPAVVQLVGLVALIVAVAMRYDGWAAVGAFGVALVFGTMDRLAHGVADAFRSR